MYSENCKNKVNSSEKLYLVKKEIVDGKKRGARIVEDTERVPTRIKMWPVCTYPVCVREAFAPILARTQEQLL